MPSPKYYQHSQVLVDIVAVAQHDNYEKKHSYLLMSHHSPSVPVVNSDSGCFQCSVDYGFLTGNHKILK